MYKMSFKNIKKVTKNGIYYLDLENKNSFIDFNKCYENWNKYLEKSRGNNEAIFKYVGQRNSDKNDMFIEFFTKPFTRFEFFENNRSKYDDIRNKIDLFGWKTIDLG